MRAEYAYIAEHQCPQCKNRKPGRVSDCPIYKNVFIRENPVAVEGTRNSLKNNRCCFFKQVESML